MKYLICFFLIIFITVSISAQEIFDEWDTMQQIEDHISSVPSGPQTEKIDPQPSLFKDYDVGQRIEYRAEQMQPRIQYVAYYGPFAQARYIAWLQYQQALRQRQFAAVYPPLQPIETPTPIPTITPVPTVLPKVQASGTVVPKTFSTPTPTPIPMLNIEKLEQELASAKRNFVYSVLLLIGFIFVSAILLKQLSQKRKP